MSRGGQRMAPTRTWSVAKAYDALEPAARPVEDGAAYYQVHGRPGPVVLHGYTAGDVEDAARAAAQQAAHRYAVAIPYPDLVDLARTGVYDLLVSQPEGGPWPWRRGALIDAGVLAVKREVRAANQLWGRPEAARDHRWQPEEDRRPRWRAFWLDWLHGTYGADPGGSMIDRLAVRQILASIADDRLYRYALLLAGGATAHQADEVITALQRTILGPAHDPDTGEVVEP